MENGKGNKAITYDKVFYVPSLKVCTNGTLVHGCELVNIHADDIIIFSANEDGMHFVKSINMTIASLYAKLLDIRRAITTIHPGITMYNDPIHFDDIGNKVHTYNLLKHLPYIPTYAAYHPNMVWSTFPCIVSANRASGGRFRVLCNDEDALRKEGQRIQRLKGGTFVTQYLDSRVEALDGSFHNFRLMVVNDTLIDWFCRPGDQWNIHTRTQNKYIQKANAWCDDWIKAHDDTLKTFLTDMYNVLGKGAYSYDTIIQGDMLYLCEVGYKFWDDTVAKLIDIQKPTKDVTSYKKTVECFMW